MRTNSDQKVSKIQWSSEYIYCSAVEALFIKSYRQTVLTGQLRRQLNRCPPGLGQDTDKRITLLGEIAVRKHLVV